jgi:hypothetical protein
MDQAFSLRGPASIPVLALQDGTVLMADAKNIRLWESEWRAIRIAVDARLVQMDAKEFQSRRGTSPRSKPGPTVVDSGSPDRVVRKGSVPRFSSWAIGTQHDGPGGWRLFKKADGEWRDVKKFAVAKGLQAALLEAFAQGGGFLQKTEALNLIAKRYNPSDIDRLMGQIKPELTRIRNAIREAIGCDDSKANPLAFDDTAKGWRSAISIGYAVQEDREHIGGEQRLRFKLRNELTREERP